jgi:hypothetical protein
MMGPRVGRRGADGHRPESRSIVHYVVIGLASQPLNEHDGNLRLRAEAEGVPTRSRTACASYPVDGIG